MRIKLKRIWLVILLVCMYDSIYAQQRQLKTGDLLFQDLPCGDFCDAINKVTPSYNGKHFSHVGILLKENVQWVVAEAIGRGVCITPLDSFIKRSGSESIYVGRIKDTSHILLPTFKQLEKYTGMPYDSVFNLNNQAMYCSELVYYLYLDKQGKAVFELAPMTFKNPDTKDFFSVWISYFQKMKEPIPEGNPGLNPGSIINSPLLYVWKYK